MSAAVIQFAAVTCYHLADCFKCGVPIFVPQSVKPRESGAEFFCCNGHGQVFRKTDKMKLQEQLDAANDVIARKTNYIQTLHKDVAKAKRSANAYKGKVTHLKKRASAGICPCCSRYFKQLHAHMENKHPDYIATPEPEAAE